MNKEKEKTMNTRKFHRLFALLTALTLCLVALSACANSKEAKYREAFDMIEAGNYEESYALFTELGDYKDAAKEAARFRYVPVSFVGKYSGEDAMPNETTTITLNENNLPAKCLASYEDGTTHTCTYTYNTNGKLEKETYRYFDGYAYTYEYTYDDQGYETKSTASDTDGYHLVNEYFYDDNGNMVKIAGENDNGVFSFDYIYDDNNRLVKVIEHDAEGNATWIEDYLYNEQGKKLKVSYTYDGKEVEFAEYTYDEKGRLITHRYHDTVDGYTRLSEYTYTADGRTEHFNIKVPDEYDDTQELIHKLVYIPFEYAEEEWEIIVRMY